MYLTLDQVLLQHISFNNRVKSSGKKTAVMHDHYPLTNQFKNFGSQSFLFFLVALTTQFLALHSTEHIIPGNQNAQDKPE